MQYCDSPIHVWDNPMHKHMYIATCLSAGAHILHATLIIILEDAILDSLNARMGPAVQYAYETPRIHLKRQFTSFTAAKWSEKN